MQIQYNINNYLEMKSKKYLNYYKYFIGIGKTTVCKKIASTLEKKGNKFDGFYTEEVRDRIGSRIGFDIVSVKDPGRRLSLARLKCVFACNNNNKA